MAGPYKVATELMLLALVLVAGLILANSGVLLLALPIAAHLMLGLLLAGRSDQPHLRAERHLSAPRIYEGESTSVSVQVENLGASLDLVLVREEEAPGGSLEGATSQAAHLPNGGTLTVSYAVRPRRGFYPLAHVRIQARDFLGFTSWEGVIACSSPLWVLPRYERLPRLGKLSPRRTLSLPGRARARREGPGVQFFGTRPYILGDDLRRLNWKALAHRDQLVVNLYEGEWATTLTVVLDCRKTAYQVPGGQELFDQAVRAAAALCEAALREEHRTGLLLYGEWLDWIFPSCGRTHRERIIEKLAQATLGSSEVFAGLKELPTWLLPRGSSVIIVSPLIPGDEEILGMLRARGHDVLVLVLLSEWTFGKTARSALNWELARRLVALERELMREVLVAAGVRVAMWDVHRPLAQALRAGWGR